jgi:hypothetical protein
MRNSLWLLGFFAVGCSPDYLVVGDGDTAVEEDLEAWDVATLVIQSPQSGDFLPWEQDNDFEAVILDGEGNEVEFDGIEWSSSVDDAWAITGRSVEDDALDVGTHAITARAELPNGDRLTYTVGGVLVQSEYAGTYTGQLRVDLISDQISTACSGASNLVIDVYGEVVAGEANCFLSIQGFDIDGAYIIDAVNDDGDLEGEILVDLGGFFELPMTISGDVTSDGELTGTFDGDLAGFAQVEGALTVNRITRATEL